MDQLITWRELGYVFCQHRPDYAQYGSLPDWARKTLAEHTDDPRPYAYSLDELEQARTHDALWNAAQSQLLREGVIHNYLRMLWGKKILEWSENPRQALERMVLLNDRYALDGRDPNSYSGVFWCLGRFDRAWGPERPGVRQGPLHDLGQHRPQAQGGGLSGKVRRLIGPAESYPAGLGHIRVKGLGPAQNLRSRLGGQSPEHAGEQPSMGRGQKLPIDHAR